MVDVEKLDPAVAERLLELDDEIWGDIYLELLDFARYKTRRLNFIEGGGDLPLGRTPNDLVQEALKRLFDGRRKWNPDQDPDIRDYLKSVISSIVSALLEKASYDHRDNSLPEDHLDLPSGENADYNDCLEALRGILEEAASDDENLENVGLGIEDNMKASEWRRCRFAGLGLRPRPEGDEETDGGSRRTSRAERQTGNCNDQ